MRIKELRIHGVGGSPGAALLGVKSLDETVVVGEGRGTVFRARRDDPAVEGYEWGELTSGSARQPLWVLLLPFTLLNLAGWAHPDHTASSWRLRAVRWLVHCSAVLLTVSYVLWTAIITVDLLGYRWLGHHLGHIGALSPAVDPRVLGTAAGLVVTLAALGLLVAVSRISLASFESADLALRPGHRGIFSPHHRASQTNSRLLGWHTGTIALTVIAVLVMTTVNWGAPQLELGRLFVVVGAVQMVLILALGVLSRSMAATAVTLAISLTNGTFSGITLLATELFTTPAQHQGPELALVESFVITLVLWLMALAAWLLFWARSGRAEELPWRTSGPGELPDGVTARFRTHISRMRGLASGAHAAPKLLILAALLFLFSSAVAVVLRFEPIGPMWGWLQPPGSGFLLSVATWLMPSLVLATMALIWVSVFHRKLRRAVGIVWDVLTFWPRQFHPLAVRPYTERAVPELQARILRHVERGGGLLISAHSQGSVLAFAALAPLQNHHLERIAMLTFGSPVTTLYGQIFPAYFGDDAVTSLGNRLRWINLYRRTDAIGGPVISSGSPNVDAAVDIEVPDPATDRQSLRPAWVDLQGHGSYHREQQYLDAATALRSTLG